MSHRSAQLSRRNFLVTIGASGAAAAAAVVGSSGSSASPSAAPSPDRGRAPRGYRESAHVARYYRSAKL